MRTEKQTSTRKNLLQLFIVAIAFCSFNTAWAFKASFTYSAGSAGAVNFTSTSSGTTSSTIYWWNPGDGSGGAGGKSATTYNHTYAYNGSYTAVLYIEDTISYAYDSAYLVITISNSATCNLHADPRFTLGAGGLVNFTATSSTGTDTNTTYSWSFGDGGGASYANPGNVYAYNGTYYPTLTISNGSGCTSTASDTVIVTNATGTVCNVQASFSVSSGLNGHEAFTSTSTGVVGYATYTWNAGDGSGNVIGGSSTFNHIYKANGHYTVLMEINADSVTCSSTDTMNINITNVTTPCNLSANYTYTLAASGVVNFSSTSSGTNTNTEYFWNAGDGSGTVKGSSTFSHTYIYQGNYAVWLIIRDTGAAYCVDSIYQYISASTADSNECHLKANFTYTVNTNGHVAFTNTSTSINSNLNSSWNFGDGSSDYTYLNTDSHIYTANGTYTVSLTTSADSANCIDTIAKVITVSNITIPCTLSASFNISNDTTKGMVNVSSTSTGTYSGTQYSWRIDSSGIVATGSSTNLHFTSNGSYTVWLIIQNTGSAYCIDSTAETVNVSNVDSLHASFTSSNIYDSLGQYLYVFTSTSTGTNGVTMYKWDAGDTTGADSGIGLSTYQHYYMNPGTHIVTLSIWFTQYPSMPHHGSTGVYERYDFSTYSMPVDVGVTGIAPVATAEENVKLYPNPNNGTFKLTINGMENSRNAELQVTNILGEVVYQSTAQITNGMIQQDINLQNINTGTYFVRIITPNKVFNTKTIITR